jgi:amidohydrolase
MKANAIFRFTNTLKKGVLFAFFTLFSFSIFAQKDPNAGLKKKMDKLAESMEAKVIAWRRDFHQNPELSNRETRTAKVIETHLKSLGMEVRTGVAKTGVVGILRGGKEGPTIALRADIDALPITERTDVPFKSKVRTTFNGNETGAMHACGHDCHAAILMGTAEVMTQVKNELAGTVVFIFQPAEEGAPKGETGGAGDMIKEGVLDNPKVETIFGLHMAAQLPVGSIAYRSGGSQASSDRFTIIIRGKQAHGGMPWGGVDPIVVGSQIVMGLQTVISRMTPLTESPAVITVGVFQGGVRENIVPDTAKLVGTIRVLDPRVQKEVHENMRRMVTNIAEASGAIADINIEIGNPVTYNDPALTKKMYPTLEETAGENNVRVTLPTTAAEDFAKYQEKIPGLFFALGGMAKGKAAAETGPHHSPDFYIDEGGFVLGMKSFCHLVLDYAAKK